MPVRTHRNSRATLNTPVFTLSDGYVQSLEAKWHNLRVLCALLSYGLSLFRYQTLMYTSSTHSFGFAEDLWT